MRALVTGGAGFLGQHVVGLARARGWEVSAPDRGALNLRDAAAVARAVGEQRPQLILHLAAMTSPAQAEADPEGAQADNVAAVAALIAAPGDARLVLVSTCHVYGLVPPTPVSEATPPAPSGVYARTKAAGEALGLAASRAGRDVVIVRPFHLTGPGHRPPYAPADWAAQVRAGATSLRTGRLDLVRDYLDVRDAAEGLLIVATAGRAGEVYNLCSGVGVPLRSLAEHIAQGRPIVEEPSRARAGEVLRLVGDPKKLGALGWAPRIPLAQSLAELVARG
ncbi:NAD-dependent epimerase/dehydratase family protein [Myxococcota bacterium]|nr:NAD-dependent epimerase/dehydratase family protein [Myxococcota bacterium]